MKSLFKTLAMTAVLAFVGVQASAQSQFSLNLLGSNPMGDFKTTTSDFQTPNTNIGNAAFGAGLGFKYAYRFDLEEADNIAPFLGFDLLWNQLNAGMRANYDTLSHTKPNYVNVPIFVGCNYKYMIGDAKSFGFYAEVGLGADILYVTPEGTSANLTKYNTSTTFAYQGGIGLCLGNTVTLGVHYYDLGNHDIVPQGNKILESAIPSSLHEKILGIRLGFDF